MYTGSVGEACKCLWTAKVLIWMPWQYVCTQSWIANHYHSALLLYHFVHALNKRNSFPLTFYTSAVEYPHRDEYHILFSVKRNLRPRLQYRYGGWIVVHLAWSYIIHGRAKRRATNHDCQKKQRATEDEEERERRLAANHDHKNNREWLRVMVNQAAYCDCWMVSAWYLDVHVSLV